MTCLRASNAYYSKHIIINMRLIFIKLSFALLIVCIFQTYYFSFKTIIKLMRFRQYAERKSIVLIKITFLSLSLFGQSKNKRFSLRRKNFSRVNIIFITDCYLLLQLLYIFLLFSKTQNLFFKNQIKFVLLSTRLKYSTAVSIRQQLI